MCCGIANRYQQLMEEAVALSITMFTKAAFRSMPWWSTATARFSDAASSACERMTTRPHAPKSRRSLTLP